MNHKILLCQWHRGPQRRLRAVGGGGKSCPRESQLVTFDSIPSSLIGETPESSPWFLLIPRFMLCGVIGLRLLCLYAVFVSLSNNSASSQVSKRNPLRGRGHILRAQSYILFLSLIPHPSLPQGIKNSSLLCRAFQLFQISNFIVAY